MINDVKTALRISSDDPELTKEVEDLIDAARMDLKISGVSVKKSESEDDYLIKRAITIYCKANYGYDNPDADRFQNSYDMLKQHLSLAGDYRE